MKRFQRHVHTLESKHYRIYINLTNLFIFCFYLKIKISGFIQYQWSKTSEANIFYALKDPCKISTCSNAYPSAPHSSFGSILHVPGNTLNSGSVFPSVLGTCVLLQKHDDEYTLTLEDPTGYVVFTVLNCSGDVVPENEILLGPIFIAGYLTFPLKVVQGMGVVSASDGFAKSVLKIADTDI